MRGHRRGRFVRSKLTGFLSRRNTASHRCAYRPEALPSCPPKLNWDMPAPTSFPKKLGQKTEAAQFGGLHQNPCCTGVPTLALSKSGYRSKVTPSSQPVLQAPVCSIVQRHYTPILPVLQDFFCGRPPMAAPYFRINSRPKALGPELLAMAAEAFCR